MCLDDLPVLEAYYDDLNDRIHALSLARVSGWLDKIKVHSNAVRFVAGS